ncbi:MAG: L-serine ammonia-lyase [Candidatus Wallbacteria bacterium GWC2_49_35]|uniref:L-serine dehydratase n=1 Tax=Candidatus Wallbacteria bacterium GWC2_49_35 TaxID=1817813 RepID=A0A1F7WGY2_9BACT|nr:MAG: L-serine ammonia-lyase [Candidatus Wallbacteria bacterium GWC2_49_35]HBC75735.1 L-serine ammonia-lyase [Candidatus Wallbacteria bacterium]
MKSVREIYKIGHGPSSSHTMGPRRAASIFKTRFPDAASYKVTLYGSLAATGRGHLTDAAIIDEFGPAACEVIFKNEELLPLHANGMLFEAKDAGGAAAGAWKAYSVGGGDLADEEGTFRESSSVYPLRRLTDILEWADKNGRLLSDYVEENEDAALYEHLGAAWDAMKRSIARGLEAEGRLPGGLNLARKAYSYYLKANNSAEILQKMNLLFSYALAVSEENASGGVVVTAPTCGSSGVLPAVLYLLKKAYNFSDAKIVRAMATAGLIGNIAKHNASISGAEVGCQGEVGVACAMAAAAAAKLLGGTIYQVEYAAEMGLEHHLGLTCDPVMGLVQIPCIERNAMAAARAFECAAFALNSDGKHRISFDEVVDTMAATGRDLKDGYRETARCGLAREWDLKKK